MLKMIGRNFIFAVAAIVFTGYFFAISAMAQSQDAVKVILVKGSPKIIKAGTSEWADCKVDMPIDSGDRIKTSGGEAVEISFKRDNSNVIKIDENSDMLVKKNQAPYSIELLNGEVMSLIRKLPKNSTFEVRTPAGVSGARGTGWRSHTDGARSTFAAFERSIYTKGIDASGKDMEGELIVRSGWRTTLERFEKPERLEKLSAKDFERWNGWKEGVEKRQETGEAKESKASSLDKIADRAGRLERVEKEGILERRDIDKIADKLKSSTSDSKQSQGSGF